MSGSKILNNLSKLLFSSSIFQASSFALLPVWSSGYSPGDIGVFASYVAFFNIFSFSLLLKLDSKLIVSVSSEQGYFDFSNTLGFTLTIVTIFSIIYGLFQFDDVIFFLFYIIVQSIFFANFLYNKAMLLKSGVFSLLGAFVGGKLLLSSILKVIFPALGVKGLIISEILGLLIIMLFFKWGLIGKGVVFRSFIFPGFNFKESFTLIKNNKSFMLWESTSGFLNQLLINLPVMVIGILYMLDDVAMYWLTYQFISAPVGFISSNFSEVMFAKFRELKDNTSELKLKYYKYLFFVSLSACVTFTIAGIICYFFIIPYFFPDNWKGVIDIFGFILLWRFAAFISHVFSKLWVVLELQYQRVIFDIVSVGVVILLSLVSYYFHIDFSSFMNYLSVSFFVLYLFFIGCLSLQIKEINYIR